jgi:aminotransferase
MINIHEPNITFIDKIEVLKSLSTHWIGKGKKVDQFEEDLKNYLKLDNITTVTSCTQGLYEIFRLLKTKTNKKEIIVASLTFIGILSSIKINDFNIVYADIDENYLSLTLESIKEKITNNTAAVVIQHYGGRPNYEIEKISNYLKNKDIYLIEDCATVLGATLDNKHLGSFGDFSVWSFDATKVITSLDGGAIYCKDKRDENIIKNNIHFGLIEAPTTFSRFNDNENKWWQLQPTSYGTKNMLNNITASLGISQLKKIDKFILKQKNVWQYYIKNIKNFQSPSIAPSNINESYFLFWLFHEKRDILAEYLKENKIFSTFRYYPMHKTNLYKQECYLPTTEKIYKNMLCIPCHKNLTDKNIEYIVKKINSF